jgi:tRNA(Ile)-lysidine synthase
LNEGQSSGGGADIRAPAPPLTARLMEDLARIWPETVRAPAARLGLAVSGGPDSLALLLLAHAARPGAVAAATVDHGLRPESAEEAAEVARICTRLGVPHETLRVAVADGNLQAEARSARYAALGEWMAANALDALATGHHADDQAETLLMRLNRAGGVAGLAGVRARGRVPGADRLLLRPLLGWRRAELGEVVAAAGLVAADDPSNVNERFDRARLRQALGQAAWLDIPAIAASAAHLADADAALEWAALREWREGVTTAGLGLTYRPAAPRAIALRVLARIVRQMDGEEPRGQALARLFDSLVAHQPASIGGLVARPLPDGWSFMKAPARRKLPR